MDISTGNKLKTNMIKMTKATYVYFPVEIFI